MLYVRVWVGLTVKVGLILGVGLMVGVVDQVGDWVKLKYGVGVRFSA